MNEEEEEKKKKENEVTVWWIDSMTSSACVLGAFFLPSLLTAK
jgi:hypothetical protein